jgi:ATP-binding cassette subfamily B protein RaxB
MTDAAIRNRQTENAECGLAALGMAASMLGSEVDLAWLRQRYPPSSRGATFKSLGDVAGAIGLSARPVRCDINQLAQLSRPAILHWNLNHFVVLDRLSSKGVRIFDPASGYATYPLSEVSKRFSGVALELSPTPSFRKRAEQSTLSLAALFSWSSPIKSALAQAFVLSLLLQCYVIASPFYMQLAIDEAALKGDVDLLLVLAIGFVVFAIFNAGAEALRGVVLQRLSLLLNWDMTHRLFHHMIRLPLTWFQRRRLADAQSRFQALDPIRNLIANGLVGAIIDGLLSIVTAVMMFIYAPSLALITLLGLVVYIALRSIAIPVARRYASDALLASIAEQGKRLETIRAMQTIKVMGGEAQRESDWSNSFAQTVTTAQTSALVSMGFSTSRSCWMRSRRSSSSISASR